MVKKISNKSVKNKKQLMEHLKLSLKNPSNNLNKKIKKYSQLKINKKKPQEFPKNN